MTRLLALALLVALVACEEAPAVPEEAVPAEDETAVAPDTVRVGLVSYGFEVSRDTFRAGTPYVFEITNEADIAHEWAVVPRGAAETAALIEVEEDELGPGATQTVTFAFPEAGAYDFACYMEAPADHYGAGMVVPVTVVE